MAKKSIKIIRKGSATIATQNQSTKIVTIKAGVTQSGGAVSNSTGSDITLAKVAGTGNLNDLVEKNYNNLTDKPVLNTNNSTPLSVSSSETISGTINLHRIAKDANVNGGTPNNKYINITLRRGTDTAWNTYNPILGDGEPGYDSSNQILKIGDGSTAWNSLTGLGNKQFLTDVTCALDFSLWHSTTSSQSGSSAGPGGELKYVSLAKTRTNNEVNIFPVDAKSSIAVARVDYVSGENAIRWDVNMLASSNVSYIEFTAINITDKQIYQLYYTNPEYWSDIKSSNWRLYIKDIYGHTFTKDFQIRFRYYLK